MSPEQLKVTKRLHERLNSVYYQVDLTLHGFAGIKSAAELMEEAHYRKDEITALKAQLTTLQKQLSRWLEPLEATIAVEESS